MTPSTSPPTIYDQYGLPFPVFADTVEVNAGVAGTPTPAQNISASYQNPITGQPVINGDIYHFPIQELSDSPEIEVAEQCTTTKRFDCPYAYAQRLLPSLPRGALLIDQEGNITRILTVRLQRQRTLKCILSITTESISFDTPPDEFSVTPVELGINIMKHPRYFYALYPDPANDTLTEMQAKQSIIRAIQTYIESPYFPSADLLNGLVQNQIYSGIASGYFTYVQNTPFGPVVLPYDPTQTPSPIIAMALAAAGEILQKLWRLEDNPYLVGWQISWAVYYYRPPILTPGGYIQDPIANTAQDNPGLPDYFYSTSNPPSVDPAGTGTGSDIFSQMANLNPQSFSANGQKGGNMNISWLRKADDITYERTWFRVTRTWIGSAIGAWDVQLFGGGVPANNGSPNRPTQPSDYLPLH